AYGQSRLPNCPASSPFRASRLVRTDGRDPFLDHQLRARAGGARDAEAQVITARAFAGKHYAVYGLARSGLATVRALLASGANVTAWDAKEEARNQLLPGTGRGTATRSGVVEGAPSVSPDGLPPPRYGEDLTIANLDEI